MGGMGRIKGEMSERQSDKAETHEHHRLYLGSFDVETMRFSLKVLCVDLQNCASCFGGEPILTKIIKRVTE